MKQNKTVFPYKNVVHFIKFTFKIHPKYYMFLILNSCLFMILTIYNSYILSIILLTMENNSFQRTVEVIMFLTIGSYILTLLCNHLNKTVEIQQCIIKEKIDHTIAEHLTAIPFEYLENEYYLDLIKKAKYSVNNEECIERLFTSLSKILQCIVTLLTLITLIVTFSPVIIVILLTGLIFDILISRYLTKVNIKFNDDNIAIDRKFDYYLDTLLNEKYGKDFRLYPIGKALLQKYNVFVTELLKTVKTYETDSAYGKAASEIVKYIEMALIYITILIIVMKNNLSISTFALYATLSFNFSNNFSVLFKNRMVFITNTKLITPLMEFLEIKPITQTKNNQKLFAFESIEFQHVSFCYPNSSRKILDDINFKINKGDKISIVGLNGAGKTTIVKLICRLYQPTNGVILINDLPIHAYDEQDYFQHISTLFQDFKIFPFSIRDNLQISDNTNTESLEKTIEKIGLKAKIDSCKYGIDTMCYRSLDIDGVEFSGGEAQKLAFGRILSTSCDLVILDEPTSAYDPITEAQFYENFSQLLSDKTIIFISHRMSSSIFSDKILLINDGQVEAFDTHKNLIENKNSLYTKLFQAQAENYK